MREKLIELLEGAKNSREIFCTARLYCSELIADHLIANGVTLARDIIVLSKWIPVTERLPEKKGNYLGFTRSTFMVGYYKGDGIWWVWAYDREGVDLFTHWMPLPEPPKGE